MVNLDQPPGERWSHIVQAYVEVLPNVINLIDTILGEGIVASIANAVFSGLNRIGVVYYHQELEGIAKVSGIPVGKVALLQIAYEVFAACTSIVVDMDMTQNDGESGHSTVTPFHIRTMDWEMEMLDQLTIEVDFVKNGNVVYTGTSWAGYVGLLVSLLCVNLCTLK